MPKEKIIITAFELFSSKGYELTSTSHIVESLNIAKGTFYHHFRSKEKLLIATLEYSFENIKKIIPGIGVLESVTDFDHFINEISHSQYLIFVHKILWEQGNNKQIKINCINTLRCIDDYICEQYKSKLLDELEIGEQIFTHLCNNLIASNIYHQLTEQGGVLKLVDLLSADLVKITSDKESENHLTTDTREGEDMDDNTIDETVFIPDK